MDYNKVILAGRLTADPELKSTQGGSSVVTITVASGRKWKDKDGNQQNETEFSRVVFWNNTAQTIGQYLKKGSLVLVEGRLKTRSYEQDGQKKYITEVIGQNIVFGPRPQNASQGSSGDQAPPPSDSDVPF